MESTYELGRARVRTNAQRINRFELPLYGDLVDARAKRLRLLLDLYADVRRSTRARRDAEHCAWRRLVSPAAGGAETCRCTRTRAPSLTFDGCLLPPVAPHHLPPSVPRRRLEAWFRVQLVARDALQLLRDNCTLCITLDSLRNYCCTKIAARCMQ